MSGYESRLNTVLAGIHPAIWLSQPDETFRKHYVQTLLFYEEIDEETFNKVTELHYIASEDHRNR